VETVVAENVVYWPRQGPSERAHRNIDAEVMLQEGSQRHDGDLDAPRLGNDTESQLAGWGIDVPKTENLSSSDETPEESIYGIDHPSMIAILTTLDVAFDKLGHHNQASSLLERSCRLTKTCFGADDIADADVPVNLGLVLSAIGQSEEAFDKVQKAAMIWKQKPGNENLNLVEILGLMGAACFKMSRFEVSIQLCENALILSRGRARKSLPILETLARSYTGRGIYNRAIEIYTKVLDIKKAVFPSEHLEVADTIHDMGITLQGMRNFGQAMAMFQRALNIYEKQIPSRDVAIRIMNATKNLGCVYSEQGKYIKAIVLFRRVLKMEGALGRNDIGTVNTLTNLGVACGQLGSTMQEMSCYTAALQIVNNKYESECDIEIGDLFYNIAVAKSSHNRSARKYLRRCISIFVTCLGDSHSKSLRAKGFMKCLTRKRRQAFRQEGCQSRRKEGKRRHR
jgi:tetratricopeptide (TPR) repeat protein